MSIGVSPAYFISKFGDDFTPDDIISSLAQLREKGYQDFQVEIRHALAMSWWNRMALDKLAKACGDCGMFVSQFICHHWMEDLSVSSRILSTPDLDACQRTLNIADALVGCMQVTVPLAKGVIDHVRTCGQAAYDSTISALATRIASLVDLVAQHGKRMALELQPGSFVGSADSFLRFCDLVGNEKPLYYNFDTGHAHACKESVHLIPFKLGSRIIGTHLCDNFGNENLSLAPGDGSIAWDMLFAALADTGYRGAYDIEILCGRNEVETAYRRAHEFVSTLAVR